ncbi:MAG: hypothetical protein IPK16_18375 [Anaerolineales bacterium]|nr:hypothetical protein [Anaerolineales bacterium]
MTTDRRIYGDQEGLVEIVQGEVTGLVERVASHRADGYVPRIEVDGKKQIDRAAIREFSDYFVNNLFFDSLRGDVSALRGRQINLLKNACEVIYRDLAAQEREERLGKASDEVEEEELLDNE